MHTCKICGSIIRFGERYYDGGYGRRAHVVCVGAKPENEMEETKKFLIENGYKLWNEGRGTEIICEFQKKVDSKSVCECNGFLAIDIHLYEMIHGGKAHTSAVVSIRAEKNKKWWHLKCYSLSFDELKNQLPKIEKTLIRMFNSI